MAITNKESGIWSINQVSKKIKEKNIWDYKGGGSLYTSGSNNYGEMGINDVVDRSSPVQVPGTYTNVSSAGNTRITAAVKTDGTLWSWGRDYGGSSGWNLPSGTMRSSPVQIPGFPPSTGWEPIYETGMIGCSILGTSYVDEDGTLFTWGMNEYGQLGHNNRTDVSSPKQVGAKGIWSQNLAFNDNEMRMCVRQGGQLFTWGTNGSGQLGHSNRTQYSSPKQVGTGEYWSTEIGTISRGGSTSAAVRTDGTLWTWGMGQGGELGHNQNDQANYDSPKQVGGRSNWRYVHCTGSTLMATNTDGELWTCGWGEYGTLGQNAVVNRSSMVQIPGTTWYRPIDGKKGSAGCTKTDGSLWVWGRNTEGAFGHNNRTNYSSPIQFGSDTTWNDNPIKQRMSISGQYHGGWIVEG